MNYLEFTRAILKISTLITTFKLVATSIQQPLYKEYSRGVKQKERHHEKISFIDEYKALLQEAGIDYEEKYLF